MRFSKTAILDCTFYILFDKLLPNCIKILHSRKERKLSFLLTIIKKKFKLINSAFNQRELLLFPIKLFCKNYSANIILFIFPFKKKKITRVNGNFRFGLNKAEHRHYYNYFETWTDSTLPLFTVKAIKCCFK